MKLLPLSIFRLKHKNDTWGQQCCHRRSVMMEMASVLATVAATGPMWLLSTDFVAGATQEMDFIVLTNYLNIRKCDVTSAQMCLPWGRYFGVSGRWALQKALRHSNVLRDRGACASGFLPVASDPGHILGKDKSSTAGSFSKYSSSFQLQTDGVLVLWKIKLLLDFRLECCRV